MPRGRGACFAPAVCRRAALAQLRHHLLCSHLLPSGPHASRAAARQFSQSTPAAPTALRAPAESAPSRLPYGLRCPGLEAEPAPLAFVLPSPFQDLGNAAQDARQGMLVVGRAGRHVVTSPSPLGFFCHPMNKLWAICVLAPCVGHARLERRQALARHSSPVTTRPLAEGP